MDIMTEAMVKEASKEWLNEKKQLHREDGPILVWNEPKVFAYYLDGKCYSFEGYCEQLRYLRWKRERENFKSFEKSMNLKNDLFKTLK